MEIVASWNNLAKWLLAENDSLPDKAKIMSGFAVHTFIGAKNKYKTYVHNWWNNLAHLLLMLTSKLYIPSTIKFILILWHKKWVSCALYIFVNEKNILKSRIGTLEKLQKLSELSYQPKKKIQDSFLRVHTWDV